MSQSNDYYSNVGGGGFMQGGSPFTGSPSSGMRRSELSHSLCPVTVLQLVKATQAHTDAEWMVDGSEIGQITLVGQVTSIQSQTTNSVYWIDDGTGRIEARHWVDFGSTGSTSKWEGIEENKYVRVTGSLKMFGSKRYINATHIRAVLNAHEIYFHILEVIQVHMFSGRDGTGPSAYSDQTSVAGMSDEIAQLPPLQRAIVRFIAENAPNAPSGVHVTAIALGISTDADAHKISDALDKLMDAGQVFSTIDDSHFSLSH